MAGDAVVSVRLDRDAGAAYLRLSTKSVARTVEFNEDVHVDLDDMGGAVGVKLLDLMTPIPVGKLGIGDKWRAGCSCGQLLVAGHVEWG